VKRSGSAVFLEVFSGSGRMSSAWRLLFKTQYAAFELDINHDACSDMLLRRVRRLVRGWVRGRLIIGIWIATPCNSMSRARNRPNGPPPLRTRQYPLGLPALSPNDQLKVERGNTLATFSFSLFLLARSLNIPVVIENPSTSWLWQQPGALNILRIRNTQVLDIDFCAFGAPWRKRTRLLYCHVDLSPLVPRKCSGRGLCSFSGRPPQVLEGKNELGIFWTHIAEPYPKGLCRLVCKCYQQALRNHSFLSLSRLVAC